MIVEIFTLLPILKNPPGMRRYRLTEYSFTKYQLTWRYKEEVLRASYFWLPSNENPEKYIRDILNIVELSSSESGGYVLCEIETVLYRRI